MLQNEDGSVIVTTSQNQTKLQCRKLILAIPPSQISKIEVLFLRLIALRCSLDPIQFEPMLPGYKREMLKHMPIGSYLKFIFVFDRVYS